LATGGFVNLAGVITHFAARHADTQDIIVPSREWCDQVKTSICIEGD
jgi:hypothetical protein